MSNTPHSVAKILSVLEGSTVTEPAASKMRKALSKNFLARRTAMSSSPYPGKSVRIVVSSFCEKEAYSGYS